MGGYTENMLIFLLLTIGIFSGSVTSTTLVGDIKRQNVGDYKASKLGIEMNKNGNFKNQIEISTKAADLPFPQWLTDFTGLKNWPGIDPPYIPLNFINVNELPNNIVSHDMGVCPADRSSCSFDCYKCVAQDDVYTCPKLSQTFDDGPTAYTPELLEKLQHKSTFFTLGLNVVKYPEIYRDVIKRGHLVGSHTWSHKFLPSLSNEEIIAQIQWSLWAMNATSGHIPKWFRPPYGGLDNRVRAILRKFGLQSVLWDYDTFDWQSISNQRTDAQIFDEVKVWMSNGKKGGLILEHDAHLKTVQVALELSNNYIGHDQMTVAQCVSGPDYIKVFPKAPTSSNGKSFFRFGRPKVHNSEEDCDDASIEAQGSFVFST